jgi:secreted Zn-dependent insulinase-like peptidase
MSVGKLKNQTFHGGKTMNAIANNIRLKNARLRILARQYFAEFGRGNANFHSFCKVVAKAHGFAYMEKVHAMNGNLIAVHVLSGAGDLIGILTPGGRAEVRGVDFEIHPKCGFRWLDMA